VEKINQMLQPKESLDNATNTTNKIDYNKLSCKEVDSKIKEFKSILMTTKMSKEKRNELEKDLKNAEIYYAKNCMVVSEQPSKPIDIIKSATKETKETNKQQISSIGKPPIKKEVEQQQQQQQQQQENNTTNQKPTTKGSSSMIKMFLVLGLIGGAIYMLQRKK
jgi:hypothetical protein